MLVVLAALLLPLLASAPAHAEDAYRYWTYWWGAADGSWEYASTGPDQRTVNDGDVEGWLFVASADPVPATQPGAEPDFAALCPDGEPIPGQVRVGVVIDFGSTADTPDGDSIPEGENPQQQCVTVPQGSTGAQVLAAAADVRTESGAVCGIAGYPSTGCFELVQAASPDAEPADEAEQASGFPVWPVVAGLVLAAAIVVLLVARQRGPSGS